MKSNYLSRLIVPAVFCLLTTLVTLKPLFNEGLISGRDVGSHILKVQLFYNALKEGQFPVRWVEMPGSTLNLPNFEFYPPLLYYLTSISQFAGLDPVTSTYLILTLATIFGWLGMYLFVRSYASPPAALAAAVVFTISPYRFSQLYVRASFIEYLGAAFIPWIFLTIKRRQYLPTAIFSALLLIAHQPTFLIISLPLLIWAVFNFNHKSYLGFILFLGLSAFFTLPLIFERQFTNWPLLNSSYYDFHLHFATLKQLIYSKWDFGISQAGPNDGMSFQLGILNWLILLTSIYLSIKKRLSFVFCFLLFVSCFSLLMSLPLSLPAWERFPVLSFVQYPWRFLILATFSTAALTPALFTFIAKLRHTTQLSVAVLISLLALIINLNYIKPSVFLPRNYFDLANSSTYDPNTNSFFGLEKGYFPIYTQAFVASQPPASPYSILQGQAQVNLVHNTAILKAIEVQATEPITIRFFVHYFPGWTATLKTANQLPQLLPISPSQPEGFVDLSLPEGNYTVNLTLKRTPVREVADFISLVSLLAMVSLSATPHLRKLISRSSLDKH